MKGYLLQLPIFEGPLELLLYLIKKDEVDIFDIPISKITEEFIAYLKLLQFLNLDDVSEFVLMAATLMQIKSKMLLPVDESAQAADEDDPRSDLVRRLMEYKQFKEVAGQLEKKELAQREIFGRIFSLEVKESLEDQLVGIDLLGLLSAFKDIVAKAAPEIFHNVMDDEVSLSQKINELLDELNTSDHVSFFGFLRKQPSKLHMIVTFLAVLELTRIKSIRIVQEAAFGDVNIHKLVVSGPELDLGPSLS